MALCSLKNVQFHLIPIKTSFIYIQYSFSPRFFKRIFPPGERKKSTGHHCFCWCGHWCTSPYVNLPLYGSKKLFLSLLAARNPSSSSQSTSSYILERHAPKGSALLLKESIYTLCFIFFLQKHVLYSTMSRLHLM